jgi:opacity protein-like surface antigen
MKRISLFATGLLLACSFEGQAQKLAQHISLGPIAGVGHSWVSNTEDQELKLSGQLGIALIYSTKTHFGWGIDLAASHEGLKWEDAAGNDMSVDPTYVRVVPKAYYFFGKYGNAVRPKVYIGPSIGFKLAEDHYYNGDRLSENTAVVSDEDVFDNIDLGLTAGAGLNVRLKQGMWLNMDGGYYHGLVDVTDADQMNRNLKFNVGLMFGL